MGELQNFSKGILKENPVFIMVLGICPALAVTTSLINAIGMGIATTFVLIFSNLVISVMKNLIPDKIRTIIFVFITAVFVTIADLLMKSIFPEINKALGIYIPLIVVNSIILSRTEILANKNKIIPTFFDSLGMGIGFTLALMIMGSIREILGNGSICNYVFVGENTRTILVFILPPGAFIVYAYMIALLKKSLNNNAQ